MKRTGLTILVAALLVGITAPLVAVELAIASMLAGVAAFVALDVVRRARQGLASDEDVLIVIDGARAWSELADGARHHEPQALMGGQAFAAHLQLVIGDTPTQLPPARSWDRAREPRPGATWYESPKVIHQGGRPL